MKADLHTHTTCSDGSKTPSQIVQWAKDKGIEVLSVTDHDSVDGLDEARDEACQAGLKFVPGIEFSTFSICEIHILGYNIDYKNPDFVQELRIVKDLRIARNLLIGEKLKRLGIKIDIDFSVDGLGRKNMACEMVKRGYCRDIAEAFEKYLGTRGLAYCESKRLTPVEAVRLIKKYGGFSSVAHPKRYLLDNRLDMLLEGLKKFGLDGLELNYPSHTEQDKLSFGRLAQKHGLLPTGGSDYHGDEDKDFVFELDKRTEKRILGKRV